MDSCGSESDAPEVMSVEEIQGQILSLLQARFDEMDYDDALELLKSRTEELHI